MPAGAVHGSHRLGAGAQCWVSLLHAGTTAKVAFNGWHTQRFPVQSGVFQGSPLSLLLFSLAVQPMSAHARQLAAQQGLHGLSLPDGQPSPSLHLHADDATVHASSPADAQTILDSSVALHIDATGARLQRSKSADMGIGCLQHLVGPDPATGITFIAAGTSVRHLGIPPQHRCRHSGRGPPHRHSPAAAGPHRPRSQAGAGGHVHIPWHLHTGARAAPQAALHIGVHLCGGQPAGGGRGSTSISQH